MRVLLSWSSGKDSAWALHTLREQGVAVAGLLTTFNADVDRVAMHAVRRRLVDAQAAAVGLPVTSVGLPSPCPNDEYQKRMGAAVAQARDAGITHIAFGDLFLRDVRDYRVNMLAGSGIQALFPIWTSPDATAQLARDMLQAGTRAVLTCVDPKQIPQEFSGREYDQALLADLPPTADPCGENGEFHTFCYAHPTFTHEIKIKTFDTVTRDGFCYTDVNFTESKNLNN